MANKTLKTALGEAANWPADSVKTATYTVTATDTTIIMNTASATHIDLPAATGSNKVYYFKNIGAGTTTVDGSGTETIDGAATKDLTQWQGMTVMDYAAGTWVILAHV